MNKVHGQYNTRLYRIWAGMKNRCCNPKSKKYRRYGGRGITICREWQNDFQAFYDWAMSHGYTDDLTINRINNDGNYSPENCEWATNEKQANNTSRNHYITHKNETHTVAEWAEILKIPYKTLFKRINDGWDIERAFATEKNPKHCYIEYKGKIQTIAEWAREYSIEYDTLKQRLNKYHWTIERALNTP